MRRLNFRERSTPILRNVRSSTLQFRNQGTVTHASVAECSGFLAQLEADALPVASTPSDGETSTKQKQ